MEHITPDLCAVTIFTARTHSLPVTAYASVSGRQASEQPVTIVLAACLEAFHALV